MNATALKREASKKQQQNHCRSLSKKISAERPGKKK